MVIRFIVHHRRNQSALFGNLIEPFLCGIDVSVLLAAENGGALKNRAMFYCDEFGVLPPIQSAEMMYSASRSRRLSIIQSYQAA